MTHPWIPLFLLLGAAACQSSTALTLADASPGDVAPDVVDLFHPGALCAAPEEGDPLPLDVVFRFHNGGTRSLFLSKGCIGAEFGVSSCASGFTDKLGPSFRCAPCDCDKTPCPSVSCGPCPEPSGLEVPPGTSQEAPWPAVLIRDELVAGNACVRTQHLPAATYRVAIRVFDTAAEAASFTGGRVVTQNFVLSNKSQSVVVPLENSDRPECTLPEAQPLPNCVATSSREDVCGLNSSFSFAWEGGNAPTSDSFQVTAPASVTLIRRSFAGSGISEKLCTASMPTCSLDARVVATADVARALAEPAIAAAFSETTVVYGQDSRPVDGSILVIRRPDGTSLAVGNTCMPPRSFCQRALLPGMANLADLLRRLAEQTRQAPSCAALLAP